MTKRQPRVSTDYEDAAQILRGYRERIERLESSGGSGSEGVQVYRKAQETVICSDSVAVDEGQAASFEWDTTQWGFGEWEDN